MSLRTRTRAGIISLVAAGVFAFGWSISRASSTPNLPTVSADRLVAGSMSAIADRVPVSGTVTTHVALGLPELPSSFGVPGASSALSLVTSDQTFSYWRSPEGTRVAQILPVGERDAVATPNDLWLWDSGSSTAWHATVPSSFKAPSPPSLGDLESTVGSLLQRIAPYANISVGTAERVAGRDAYSLVLTPRSPRTLVSSIQLAIDSATRVPLQLEIIPKGSVDPAVSVGFTSVSFGSIDPSIFAFSPPPATTVHQIDLSQHHDMSTTSTPAPEVRTFGQGFGLIFAVPLGNATVPSQFRSLLPYSGPLGSAELIDKNGATWLVGGAVRQSALQGVGSQLP
jgi:hypothetical protein